MLQRAARSQRNLLGKVPELLSLGIALGTVAKSPCAGSSFVAMSVLGLYCLEIDAERFQSEFKPVLLQLYTDSTFGSSTPQPKHVLQSFAPLLRTLTHEEYAAQFQTKAEQLLKQRPETIVSAVASLVDAVQLDMSRYVEPLIPLAIRLLKSSNEAARDYAVSLLSGLSKRCSDPAALTGMVGELEATLAGKGGALTLWEQRYAAVLALRGVRDGVALLPPAAAADIAAVAAEALTTVLEKESHEATKMLVLAALGDWLNMSTVAPSKKLFKVRLVLRPSVSCYLRYLPSWYFDCLTPLPNHYSRSSRVWLLPPSWRRCHTLLRSSRHATRVRCGRILRSWCRSLPRW